MGDLFDLAKKKEDESLFDKAAKYQTTQPQGGSLFEQAKQSASPELPRPTLTPGPTGPAPGNLTQAAGRIQEQRQLSDREMLREAGQIDSEALARKVQSGQQLTPVEARAWQEQSGQAIPTRELETAAVIGTSLLFPPIAAGPAALGTVGRTALGSGLVGSAENVAIETASSLAERRLPDPKELAVSAGAGFLGGAVGGAIASGVFGKTGDNFTFGRKVKDIADFYDTSPSQINKYLKEVAEQAGTDRGTVADGLINHAARTQSEGADAFAKYLDDASMPTRGVEGVKAAPEFAPQIEKTNIGQVFEGNRVTGDVERGLVESGVDFQSPAVREAYLGSPFQAPETREAMRQSMIKESSLFTRPVKAPSPVLRAVENEAKSTNQLIKEVADETGYAPQAVLRDAHVEARKAGKTVKEVLSETVAQSPTTAEKIDVILGPQVVSNVYKDAPEIANRINLDYQERIRSLLPEGALDDMLDNLDRPITPRRGNTVSATGKVVPNYQAIAGNNEKLANMMENFVKSVDPVLPDKVSIPLDETYQLAKELPKSDLAAFIADPQKNLDDLYQIQIRVTAARQAARHHFEKRIIPLARKVEAGEISEDVLFNEMAIQTQLLDSVGLTSSGTGRLFRSLQDTTSDAADAKLFMKRLDGIFGKAGKERKRVLTEIVRDMEDLTPENRIIALAELQEAGMWEKWRFIMKNGMLSGTRTHEKNLIGNQLLFAMQEAERAYGAAADAAVSAVTGKPRERFFRESVEAAVAYPQGYKQGFLQFFRKFRNGVNRQTASKFDLVSQDQRIYRNPLGSGRVARAVEVPVRMLDAADSAQKELITEVSTNVLAYRYARQIAAKQGIKAYKGFFGRKTDDFVELYDAIRMNPTDELLAPINKTVKEFHAEIEDAALRGTFQNPVSERIESTVKFPNLKKMSDTEKGVVSFGSDPLGSVGSGVIGLRRYIPPLDVVLPFLKTPANIMRMQFERMPPFSLAISGSKLLARRKAGAPLQLAEEIAKNAIGATLAGGTALATYEGFLSGGVIPNPKRRGLRQLSRSSQDVPYSIIIGDTQIPYIFLEPIGPMVALYADATELSMAYPFMGDEWRKGMLASFANNVSRRSYLESLGVLMDAWGGEWDKVKDGLAFMLVGNALPFSGIARQMGETFDARRSGGSFVQKLMEQLPFLRKEAPPIRNVWGEEIYNADTMVKRVAEMMGVSDQETLDIANKVGMVFTPLPTFEKISNDPVDKSMLKIMENMGPKEKFELAGAPTKAGKISHFTDEQFDAFRAETGQMEKQRVQAYLTSIGAPDGVMFVEGLKDKGNRTQIIKTISRIRRGVREDVRAKYLRMYPAPPEDE